MGNLSSIRAFSKKDVRYFRLKKDIGPLKAGAIFWLNEDDKSMNLSYGTLMLCWTPKGNCYSGMCGGNVILNYPSFTPDPYFGSPGKDIFEEVGVSVKDIKLKQRLQWYILSIMRKVKNVGTAFMCCV